MKISLSKQLSHGSLVSANCYYESKSVKIYFKCQNTDKNLPKSSHWYYENKCVQIFIATPGNSSLVDIKIRIKYGTKIIHCLYENKLSTC